MKWLVLWSLWAAQLVRQPTVTLQLSNGPVRGAVAADGSHAQYLATPYATVTHRFQETELLLKTNEQPVYNYVFQYSGRRNIAMSLLPSYMKEIKGATHADELFYLFSQSIIPLLFENEMGDKMSTMWANFAKYEDPTPDFTKPPIKWHRTNSSSPTALVINTEFETSPLWLNERVKYLKEVYSKFRRKR